MKRNNQSASALLREVARILLQLQRTEVACCGGTTSTQCFILGEVGRAGSLTLADLGRRLALDKGWISRAVDLLEQDGFLIKLSSETDRRTIVISLSRAGERRFAELDRVLNDQLDRVLGHISRAERIGVDRALVQLHEALQSEASNTNTTETSRTRTFKVLRKAARSNNAR